jgi:4-hydroxybenzoyl-CoA thioesterase
VKTFDVDYLIRFAHCDTAGIVFYPRYFEMFNSVVEDWFEGPLQCPWGQMHRTDRRGVPLVDIQTRFMAASKLGDYVTFQLSVISLGRSAITIRLRAHCAGEPRLEAKMAVVYTDIDKLKSARIPDDLRARIAAFVEPAQDEETDLTLRSARSA